MGGCCCCPSKGVELNSTPAYYYYPRASEEHLPLSSNHGAASGLPTGLLVDTNLDTSEPDSYRPPPTPLPFDVGLAPPQTGSVAQEIHNSKNRAAVETTNSDPVQEAIDVNAQNTLTKSDKAESNIETDPTKQSEVELSKSAEAIVSAAEEDVCPTCLEEYDAENPKITAKCEHHFHLACILEWKERSDTCPVCNEEMIFNTAADN
ncbi:hypothetical protein SLE2022_229070 [Rubroshorea leprosula]